MYVPNPATIDALHIAAHFAWGAIVSTRAAPSRPRTGMAFAYGVTRAMAGVVIGLPLYLLTGIATNMAVPPMIAVFAIPRLMVGFGLIDALFKPRGGRPETMLWALVGVAASSAIDWFVFDQYAAHEWLRMTWC